MRTSRTIVAASAQVSVAFLAMSCSIGATQAAPQQVKSATAITEVFGEGQKLTAVALEYDQPIDSTKLSAASFRVDGRTVTGAYASASASVGQRAPAARYVIVELSPDDATALLRAGGGPGGGGGGPGRAGGPPGGGDSPPGGPGGPGGRGGPPNLGPKQVYKPAVASVSQSGPVVTSDGQSYAPFDGALDTTRVVSPIVDDFKQLEFRDPKTGVTLKYNLFVPKGYDKNKAYPLVLFMHDAGVLSFDTTTALKQGLGAVIWASPADQAKHPSFVLAPQYSNVTANDDSTLTKEGDATINLVEALASEYHLDRSRLYTTGQSMGAMMSIANNIKYPGLFAASYIVAGQWDPAKVAPLATQKMWIVVSQGDLKAYPGQNAITAELEKHGAKVSRAVWSGRSSAGQFAAAVAGMEAEGSPINYAALAAGTVVPPGQSDNGGSNHVNTWRIAYSIEGIRDWLFKQHK